LNNKQTKTKKIKTMENKINFIPTTEKIISENYPYGFREKTTKTDYLEFDFRKGFRHCSMTINPKTGKENKPKKSVYYNMMILGTDEKGHCKSFVLDFNGSKSMQRVIDFLQVPQNFALFTEAQIEYFYMMLLSYSKVNLKSQVVYCGTDLEQLKPYYEKPIEIMVKAINTKGKENLFSQIVFDWEAIEGLKVPNYQPFVVTKYEHIGGQLVKVN
jgi:hypothetical protein